MDNYTEEEAAVLDWMKGCVGDDIYYTTEGEISLYLMVVDYLDNHEGSLIPEDRILELAVAATQDAGNAD